MAVVTALLHDVLDDTSVTEEQMREEFGREITEMVKKVSRLSALNQLLRRKRRKQHESGNQASFTLQYLLPHLWSEFLRYSSQLPTEECADRRTAFNNVIRGEGRHWRFRSTQFWHGGMGHHHCGTLLWAQEERVSGNKSTCAGL